MNMTAKIAIIVLLAAAVGGVVAMRTYHRGSEGTETTGESVNAPIAGLPRLVEFGSDSCIPCKRMTPILAELKSQYAGRLNVEFYDIRKDPEIGRKHEIDLMPTQIFYDASGRELFRHTGFFPKDDILAKWKELGVDLSGSDISPISTEPTDPNA